jgi:hypothetical protein
MIGGAANGISLIWHSPRDPPTVTCAADHDAVRGVIKRNTWRGHGNGAMWTHDAAPVMSITHGQKAYRRRSRVSIPRPTTYLVTACGSVHGRRTAVKHCDSSPASALPQHFANCVFDTTLTHERRFNLMTDAFPASNSLL